MPCDSSHMEPTRAETLCGTMAVILEELDGTPMTPDRYRNAGMHPRTYDKSPNVDEWTRSLCERFKQLGPMEIATLSLEAQMWWRDHQKG